MVNSDGYLHPLVEGFEVHPDRSDVVVLMHGWTGSPAHMRLLAAELDAAGFGAVAPLLPGHGTTIRDMLDVTWRDWVATAAEAAQRVVDSGARLHLAGLSMGGVLAILLAPVFRPASLITINAPIRVVNRTAPFLSIARGSPRIRDYEPAERHPEFAHDYAHHYDGTPIGSVADLLDLIRAAKSVLNRVSAPALVVQSLTDETVRPASATYLYEHLGSPFKRLVWLERSAHVATLDIERDRLAQEVVRHLRDAQGLATLQPPG
jgi:carboxylesterase